MADQDALSMPSASDLANFLDGTDQQDAVDTAALTERTAQEAEESDDTVEATTEPEGDTFDRKYVEKLRRENASYRERAKKYADAFEGYEDGAVDEWKQIISGFKNDPKGTAEYLKNLSEQVLQNFTPAEQEAIAEAVQDEDQPLTMKQLETILKEREDQYQMQEMVSDIEAEARELGYDLKSREYKILLMTAQEIPSGDLKEAHELLEAERQRYFDSRISELEKTGSGYRVPSDKVGVPDTAKGIKDFKDAKAALSNYLDANFGK